MLDLKIVWVNKKKFDIGELLIEYFGNKTNCIICLDANIYSMMVVTNLDLSIDNLSNDFPSLQLSEKWRIMGLSYYTIEITDSSEFFHFMLSHA